MSFGAKDFLVISNMSKVSRQIVMGHLAYRCGTRRAACHTGATAVSGHMMTIQDK